MLDRRRRRLRAAPSRTPPVVVRARPHLPSPPLEHGEAAARSRLRVAAAGTLLFAVVLIGGAHFFQRQAPPEWLVANGPRTQARVTAAQGPSPTDAPDWGPTVVEAAADDAGSAQATRPIAVTAFARAVAKGELREEIVPLRPVPNPEDGISTGNEKARLILAKLTEGPIPGVAAPAPIWAPNDRFLAGTAAACVPARLQRVLSEITHRFGSVRITSAHRTPQRNRAVGGAPRSMHLECRAVDFKFAGRRGALLKYLHANPAVGGIGTYGANGHIHIDDGPRRVW